MGGKIRHNCPKCSWSTRNPDEMARHMIACQLADDTQRVAADEPHPVYTYSWPIGCMERVTADEGCKQVMLDGHHIADAVSPEAAQAIAVALNYVNLRSDQMPDGPRLTIETFLA